VRALGEAQLAEMKGLRGAFRPRAISRFPILAKMAFGLILRVLLCMTSEFKMQLTSTPVRARTRKLRTRWRAEAHQDLKAYYDASVESQFVNLLEGSSMRQITVEKVKLLEVLAKNRAEHRAVFLEAQMAFRAAAIEALDKQLDAARKGSPFELRQLVALVAPEDHTAAYDRSIQMLHMSVDEKIVISEQEFQNYVQDIWDWSRNWACSNVGYVSQNSRSYEKISALACSNE